MFSVKKKKRCSAIKRIRSKFGRDVGYEILIFCSSRNIYAQVVNLKSGKTEITVSTCDKNNKANHRNIVNANKLGKELAEKCRDKNISSPSFNRGEKIFHGIVKNVADSFYGN